MTRLDVLRAVLHARRYYPSRLQRAMFLLGGVLALPFLKLPPGEC